MTESTPLAISSHSFSISLRSLIGLRYASTSTKVVRFGISLSFLAPM